MRIVTFSTHESDGSQPPRVGAELNAEYLLDFEGAFEGAERPASHLAWLDMDGRWFQKSREKYEAIVSDPSLIPQAIEKGWLTKRLASSWFPPVPRPGKLICTRANCRDHAPQRYMPIPERPVVFC